MRTRCLMAAGVAFFLIVAGCVSIINPYTSVEELAEQRGGDEQGQGYVGITGMINIHNLFNTFFKLQFEFMEQTSGKTHVVKINQNYVQELGHSGTYPIIFALPPGTYAFKGSEIYVPGGIYKKTRFLDTHRQLGVEAAFPPFEVRSGEFIHIGIIAVQHVSMREDYYYRRKAYFTLDIKVAFGEPAVTVWKDFEAFLKERNPRYVRRLPLGEVDFPTILWMNQDL